MQIYLAFILLFITSYIKSDIIGLPWEASRSASLELFIPPESSCSVFWAFNPDQKCEWCDELISTLMQHIRRNYIPSTIYTEVASVNKYDWPNDFKGYCFINWFIAEQFDLLETVLSSNTFNEFRGDDDWFIFIPVSILSYFYIP